MTTEVVTLTNGELQEAITRTLAMVRGTSTTEPSHYELERHLQDLLQAQKERAHRG